MSETRGFTIEEVAPRSIAAIGAFRNRAPLLAVLESEFGVAPPPPQTFIQTGSAMLSCLTPTRFIVTAQHAAALATRLADALGDQAAITDQSDLWYTASLSGPAIQEILARIAPIDLDPERFPVGRLAQTRAGHIEIRLWRVADQAYELATARSYVPDLRHALDRARHG